MALINRLARFFGRAPAPMRAPHLFVREADEKSFREWGYFDQPVKRSPRVLITAGYGYGNVGDEAQVGACMERWRQVAPNVAITMLSPNPPYTRALHGECAEWATRVAWFRSNTLGPYAGDRRFRRFFGFLKLRLEISARFLRADLPLLLLTGRETRILELIQENDVIHISGGGYLTGKTRSRLWDYCLLMHVCRLLGKPVMLTGHNIGVFQDGADRRIARMGLRSAFRIGLRDRGISERELAGIGISGDHVRSTCDDALFCNRLGPEETALRLREQGVDPAHPWVAVNFHHWGMDPSTRSEVGKRFALVCDEIRRKHGYQIVLIAMTPSDVEPEASMAAEMKESCCRFPYSPDYKVVRGIIADAAFVFTMKHHPIVFGQGEGVPVLSVALDNYYLHKNKGAMDNTGDGEFLVSTEGFWNGEILDRIEKVILDAPKIRSRMNKWTEEMRAIELDPYREALSLLGFELSLPKEG